jgi:hypothetical protein
MKRFREGYTFPKGDTVHLWSRFDPITKELEVIPADSDWQFMFRFFIEEEKK